MGLGFHVGSIDGTILAFWIAVVVVQHVLVDIATRPSKHDIDLVDPGIEI